MALQAAAPLLVEEHLVRDGVDLNQLIVQLVDTQFARNVVVASV